MKKRLVIGIIIVAAIVVLVVWFYPSSPTECVKEGEKKGVSEECCAGLKIIPIYNDNTCEAFAKSLWYCTNCGDEICKSPEDKCNCPNDCE